MSTLDVGALVADTYEITRLIGRGGMGEVWLASHRRLPGKQVAIKVLHTGGQQLSADALARFRHEAEIATRINHPNIVEVHDFNTLPSGAPYVVLEFLQGESLASRLRFGPLTLEEAQGIVRQVGSALQAAHAHGVVHRDLKPDNIFLVTGAMGVEVKVLDFGISKLTDSNTVQTRESVLVGTPAYMSPEQALGNNKDVGPQSDVFALGSIAYEMLAGRQTFTGEAIAQLVFKIAYEPHLPLDQAKPGLPPPVVQAVEQALVKDRAHRTADVASFVAQFTGAALPGLAAPGKGSASGVATPNLVTPDSLMMAKTAAPSQPPVPPATPAPPPASGRRGHRLSGALVVVALALAASLLWRNRPLPEPPVPPGSVEAKPVEDAGPVAVVPAPPDAAVPVVAPVDAGRKVAGSRKLKLPPAEELPVFAEVEAALAARQFGPTLNANVSQLVRQSSGWSPVAQSYASLLATQAHCGHRDLANALARYRQLDEPSHQQAARTFCAQYGISF